MAQENSGELVSRVAALETKFKSLEDLMRERDLRYKERAEAQEKSVVAAINTSREAVTKAETATERRLEGLNELRAMAMDQAKTFAREDKVDFKFEAAAREQKAINSSIDSRLSLLERAASQMTGRGVGMSAVMGFIVTAITCLIGVATLVTAIIALDKIH